MNDNPEKGRTRERELDITSYYSDEYFSLPVLFSHVQQIKTIYDLKPRSVLEIGIGNGFVSSFLKRSGMKVLTCDINPDLQPDICAPLDELPKLIDQKFDLVVCCEVLEHLPLSELDECLDVMRSLGERLFMTLPNIYGTIGFGAFVRLPRIGRYLVDAHLNLPYKHKLERSAHYWEVGYSRECSRKNIVKRLNNRYPHVKSSRMALNPYHYSFVAQ